MYKQRKQCKEGAACGSASVADKAKQGLFLTFASPDSLILTKAL
jgi:hypothetical protein